MRKKDKNPASTDGTMSLSGHLKELRNRLIICVICLVVSFLVGLYFAPSLIEILTDIGKQYQYEFIYISPQELLLQQFSMAFLAGICITLPVILYHVWAFIQPGLKKNENALFLCALVFGLVFFILGVIFAFKIMMPFMLRFLISISTGTDIQASVSVGNYLSFLKTIFIIFGIVFELPVVSVVLTQLGLIRVEWMRKGRKFIIIIIFFIAAVITPPDVVSQVMVAIPMIGLYEISILICAFLLKFKKPALSDDDQDEDK